MSDDFPSSPLIKESHGTIMNKLLKKVNISSKNPASISNFSINDNPKGKYENLESNQKIKQYLGLLRKVEPQKFVCFGDTIKIQFLDQNQNEKNLYIDGFVTSFPQVKDVDQNDFFNNSEFIILPPPIKGFNLSGEHLNLFTQIKNLEQMRDKNNSHEGINMQDYEDHNLIFNFKSWIEKMGTPISFNQPFSLMHKLSRKIVKIIQISKKQNYSPPALTEEWKFIFVPKSKNFGDEDKFSSSKDWKQYVSSKAMFTNKEIPSSMMLDTGTTQSMLDLVYVPLSIPVYIAWNTIVMNTKLYLGYSKQIINEINGCHYSLLGQK